MGIFDIFSNKKKEDSVLSPLIKSGGSDNFLITVYLIDLMEDYIKSTKNKIVISDGINDYYALQKSYSDLVSLGLVNTKNARILKEKIDSIRNNQANIQLAKNTIEFLKSLRKHFGEFVILIGPDQFRQLCSKYKLSIGTINNYTGIIPDSNIKELKLVSSKIDSFKYLNHIYNNSNFAGKTYLWNINSIVSTASSLSDDEVEQLRFWVEKNNNLVYSIAKNYKFDGSIWLSDIIDCNPDLPEILVNYPHKSLMKLQGRLLNPNDFLIACPSSQLRPQSINITVSKIDPIVFQYSSYGVIIYSVWGEEAEDVIFEKYKEMNNLMSIL